MDMGKKAMDSNNCPLAIKYFEKAKAYTDKTQLLDKLINKCQSN